MEFLVISENKLKIMLTQEEMRRYGIEENKSDYKDHIVRKSFWQILDRAREECGFESRGEKILMQYFPSRTSAEIFVTKLGRLPTGIERSISATDSVTMLSSKNMIYRIENMEELSRLYRIIKCGDIESGSEAYLSDDGYYYIFFEERSEGTSLSPYAIASEFGEEIPQTLRAYIREHSERLCEIDIS